MLTVKLQDTFDLSKDFYIKVLTTLIQENMFFCDISLRALTVYLWFGV